MKAVLVKTIIVCSLILAVALHPRTLRAQDLDLEQAKAGADKGDPNAEFCLGRFYDRGEGVPQDYAKAAELYRKAAEQGFGKAQHNLATMYMQGQGVKKDQAEAIKWFRKAAAQGMLKSQVALGALLVKKDNADPEGIEFLRKAAEQGDAFAQVQFGNLYYVGDKGVKRDFAEAAKWFRLAANQGNPVAENAYGVMNEDGFGMPMDTKAALEWYRKSAEQGDPKGEANYGRMFADKLPGIEYNPAKAYLWLSLAAAQREPMGTNFLKEYVAGMSPDELAEGKRLLEEYNANHPNQAGPAGH